MKDVRLGCGLLLSEVAKRAGWKKGAKAKLSDLEVARLYDVKPDTVCRWRHRCKAKPKSEGIDGSWSDADFEIARLTLVDLGRSIPALHQEYLRRLRSGLTKATPSKRGKT